MTEEKKEVEVIPDTTGKGVSIVGGGGKVEGGTVTVGGAALSGVKVVDRHSKTDSPKVEITHGEGDTGNTEQQGS